MEPHQQTPSELHEGRVADGEQGVSQVSVDREWLSLSVDSIDTLISDHCGDEENLSTALSATVLQNAPQDASKCRQEQPRGPGPTVEVFELDDLHRPSEAVVQNRAVNAVDMPPVPAQEGVGKAPRPKRRPPLRPWTAVTGISDTHPPALR